MESSLFRIVVLIISGLLLMPCPAIAQLEQTTAGNPPLEQPLVREGDLAVKLVEALKLGTPESETEALGNVVAVTVTLRETVQVLTSEIVTVYVRVELVETV